MAKRKRDRSNMVDELLRDRRLEEFRDGNTERIQKAVADEEFRRVAATMFVNMAEKWRLGDHDAAKLLDVDPLRIVDWRKGDSYEMDAQVFEKISYLVGIYRMLCLLYVDGEALVYRWMTTPRDNMGCHDQTPLSMLTDGGIEAFAIMRDNLAQISDELN